MKTIIILIAVLLSGCTAYSASNYVGTDLHPQSNNEGIYVLQLKAEMGDKYNCIYQHRSDIGRGFPFNDSPETASSELVLCGFTYNF